MYVCAPIGVLVSSEARRGQGPLGLEFTDGLSHPVAALKQTWVLEKIDYLMAEPSAQQ